MCAQACPTLWPTRLLCSWDFFRQECWSQLPFPLPGYLPHPGIEPVSPALIGRFFITEPPFQFSSVAQSCLTLGDPMECSTPGLPVHYQLFKLMSIESVMPSNHLIFCCPLLLPPSVVPSIRVFSNQFYASGGQSVGVAASASVLPMNIQD